MMIHKRMFANLKCSCLFLKVDGLECYSCTYTENTAGALGRCVTDMTDTRTVQCAHYEECYIEKKTIIGKVSLH